MKVLKATLAFVLGIVLGIILLMLAIGGTVLALGLTTKVGTIQSAVTNEDIIDPESDLYDQTVLEAAKQFLEDYQHFDKLSLKVLYEHYGINLLKGISGLDFTKKDFFATPLADIVNDLSLLLNDLYLSDIGQIADLDFLKYNIPIINENLNVGIPTAIDNILNIVNGDLSIRLIKNKLGLDLGVENNDILKALQDVNLKEIGGLIDALRIGTLLKANTDTYLPKATVQIYVSTEGTEEEWEEVSESDLQNPDYTPEIGVETYIVGGDGDGNLVERELRYYKYEGKDPVVDNSCYGENWVLPEGATLVRHRLYKRFDGNGESGKEYFAEGFANHVEFFSGNEYTLLHKEFVSLDDIKVGETGAKLDKTLVRGGKLDLTDVEISYTVKGEEGEPDKTEVSGEYSILDKEIIQSSLLRIPDEKHPYIEGRGKYVRVYQGTSSPLLQYLNYLTIGYIRSETDEVLKSVRIGDIIDTDAPGTADILKALKDSTLDSIGSDINTIPLGQIFDVEGNKLLEALQKSTLKSIPDDIEKLKLGQIVDVEGNRLLEALQESTLKSIPDDINTLTIGQIIDLTEKGTPQLLIALDARGCTLNDIGTKINDLTVGELMEVDFDTATEDTNGAYVRVPQYVKYNEEVPATIARDMYGPDARRGAYDEETKEFTPSEDWESGEYVEVFSYVLYEEAYHAGQQRYTLTEGKTALAVQSLSKRGVKALEMGNHINELSIGELMRVEADAAYLFKSLARKGSTLDEIAADANTLEIGEIIEINEESSQIMKSLAARHCTLENMATITNDLTLEEMIEIVPNIYEKNPESGRYVHVTAEGYVPYDKDNTDHAWRKRYTSDDSAPGGYRQDDNGEFVHAAYYTLYNPAVHYVGNPDFEIQSEGDDSVVRFDKKDEGADGKAPSSTIMQRFASATMDSFSNAFDEVLMSDVMDISIDIYAPVPTDSIKHSGTEYTVDGYDAVFRYDKENSVYRIATQNDMANAKEHPENRDYTLYSIVTPGEGAAILRKLAFVKVSDMEGAMEAVMQDLMLSEIIDVYADDAVSLPAEETEITENDFFFFEWDGTSMINGKPAIYLYNAEMQGKYFLSDFIDEPIEKGDAKLKENGSIWYKYQPVTELLKDTAVSVLEGQAKLTAYKAAALLKATDGNMYIKQGDKYLWNIPLASYLIGKKLTLEKSVELYYREKVEGEGDGAIELTTYAQDGNIYINLLGEDVTYDPEKPWHDISVNSDFEGTETKTPKLNFLYRHQEEGKKYFAPIGEPKYEYDESKGLKYGAQYCHDVYFSVTEDQVDPDTRKSADGKYDVYVFDGSTYHLCTAEQYPNIAGLDLYIKKIGYVAVTAEAYYLDEHSEWKTDLNPIKVDLLRQRSSSVLRMLANKTINEMNDVIKDAKMGDLIEITPGTIFDNEEISNATISDLGIVLSRVFTSMTVGELLSWSNITGVDPRVKETLQTASLVDFFMALGANSDGEIVVDIAKLYGWTDSSATP